MFDEDALIVGVIGVDTNQRVRLTIFRGETLGSFGRLYRNRLRPAALVCLTDGEQLRGAVRVILRDDDRGVRDRDLGAGCECADNDGSFGHEKSS